MKYLGTKGNFSDYESFSKKGEQPLLTTKLLTLLYKLVFNQSNGRNIQTNISDNSNIPLMI